MERIKGFLVNCIAYPTAFVAAGIFMLVIVVWRLCGGDRERQQELHDTRNRI